MSENSQLIYVKILMLAAETGNKIPKSEAILKSCLRSSLAENDIKNCLKEIRQNFPKFVESGTNYYFKEWNKHTNWTYLKELPRKSQGTPKESQRSNRKEEKGKEEKGIDNAFLSFYNSYPKKIGKKVAERAWGKIDLNEHKPIFTALEAFKKSEQWLAQGGKFIPYPATWLNQERWKDELPAPAPKKAFYNGAEMRQFDGKWKVKEKGQWLKYGGKLSEIEWR